MAIQSLLQSPLLNALYCEEEDQWEEEEHVENNEIHYAGGGDYLYPNAPSPSLFPVSLLQQDSLWEDDEELISLLHRENKQQGLKRSDLGSGYLRWEAVHWMVKANAHFGFSTLTAILSIDYLDRFLSTLRFDQSDKPWMIQLVAVTCLSLAAKVEETQVPLPLDLQVETEYVFEPKTIQKMELMVLSALKWRMNPVTPLSFLDYIITKLGLKTIHWEFLSRCESLLVSVSSDSKFVHFLPSVLATATMCHVINQMEPLNPMEYQNLLLGILNTSKGKVNECYELIVELSVTNTINDQNIAKNKRKLGVTPASPSGVVDVNFSTSDCSNDSWDVAPVGFFLSSSTPKSQEPLLPLHKKSKVTYLGEDQIFVDASCSSYNKQICHN